MVKVPGISRDRQIAQESGTVESRPQVEEEGQKYIVEGDVYRQKGDPNTEVTPYFVDYGSATVQFNTLGRGNEDRMRTSDFLNRFEHVGPVSANIAEEQKERPAHKEDTERA